MAEQGWQIAFDRAPVNVVPPPIRSFDLYGNVINSSADPRIPLFLEYAVYFMNRRLVPGYEEALLQLGEAQKALAEQNWRLVLIKLWNVFESVGAAASEEGETGFERLLREALPHEHYREVRSALGSLIAYLRLYQQRFMEAYGEEHIPVTREDALFAFEMTLSILAYLTKRMTGA